MPGQSRSRSAEKVRFSRDGDQFHYSWAARRCLKLLSPASGVVAVTIEGVSTADANAKGADAGTEVIDVAEYCGTEDPTSATSIRYVQLKHSTLNSDLPWPPSGLKKTLVGFAKRYRASTRETSTGTPAGRVQFSFISNRPIGTDFLEAIEDAAAERESRHPTLLKKLETFTKLKGAQLSSFCRSLNLIDAEDNFLRQRLTLVQETRAYLPGDDADAPVQLKELVTRKATSEFATNPTIVKTDVLRVLGTTEDRLFPAPSRIELGERSIQRVQERDLAAAIIGSAGTVVVHAAGGVGKSIFSQRLKHLLPAGSVHLVYDCFGHGEYRRPGSPRHRHKDALVQITNELASQSLCDPLIPSSRADASDYLKAFAHRLAQTVQAIRNSNTGALVCICLDAADNAEMAAREFGGERSFVRDLIREPAIPGVRLVFLCRTERQDHLDPRVGIPALELKPFLLDETAALLRRQFPSASEQDVAEFHRLTSRNPRVQATALAQSGSLNQILLSLGPNPKGVDSTIASLLEQAVAETREKFGSEGRLHVDSLCAALAVLRPLVPIEVLAHVAGTSAAAIRSFASDIGRPLLVTDDAVQFRDEPVETWFRTRFKADPASLANFVERLRPLASHSAYVASTLPQLLLEAGRLNELVALALSSTDLPANNPIERRDIELQRLQFALRASLRGRHLVAAAKLAFRAGGEMTGDARQRKLLQDNTDLVGAFLEPERVRELASRRTFGAAWLGSHHAYDAALLSSCPAFLGDARSSLRMAEEWLRNWGRLSDEERGKEKMADDDIAALAMAHLNVHGPEVAARFLSSWRPREVSFRAGRLVARRLADHCRWSDLDAVAAKANVDARLVLGVCLEAHALNRRIPKKSIATAVRILSRPRVIVRESTHFGSESDVLDAMVALVSTAVSCDVGTPENLAALLSRYLPDSPPRTLASRHGGERRSVIAGYCLRAGLLDASLDIKDIADSELAKELADAKTGGDTSHRRDFFELVGSVLPWHQLRTDVLLNRVRADALPSRIAEAEAKATSAISGSYHDYAPTVDEVAALWFDVLVRSGRVDLLQGLNDWVSRRNRPLFTPTLTRFARVCARTPTFEATAYGFAQQAYGLTKDAREDAESQATAYLELARAIFAVDRAEGNEYFGQSMSIAGKLGDEIIDRWTAVLELAERAASTEHAPELAYELSRRTEVAYRYFARDKHFDWHRTISAIAGLCPNSSLAVLSRWHDRDFGSSQRLLPAVVDSLLDNGVIDPVAASTLIGFRADWRYASLLRKCLGAVSDQRVKQGVLDRSLAFMRLETQSAKTWKKVRDLVLEHQLQAGDIDESIEFAERAETAASRSESSHWATSRIETSDGAQWLDVFNGLEMHSSVDIGEAYRRFKSLEPPFYHERFFAQLCGRVAVGREADCVRAVGSVPELDLFDYKHFFESIPPAWLERLAVPPALSTLAIDLYKRHSLDIARSQYYERLPFELVTKITGVAENTLIDAVLSALGESAEPFDAGRLFTLVGLLAPRLSHDEAVEALRYSLTQFDDVMQPDDGDGAWSSRLAPPQDTATSLAGYIFAALSAPTADRRWEAAHIVRGLCAMGCDAVVRPLVAFATISRPSAFADAGLHFYELHGRQWLLVALSRAAMESPRNVAPYVDTLLAFAQAEHVLVRHFASTAVVALADSGEIEIESETRTKLLNINRPVLPRVSSKRWKRLAPRPPKQGGDQGARFSFDYELAKYSLDSLSAIFATYKSDLEDLAGTILRDEWGLRLSGRWDEDLRAKRGLLREHRPDSDRPKAESLDWYLSYHLMMTVAARLQATATVHQDPDDNDDEYVDWLHRFILARDDGRWLADRRDPAPREWPLWKSEKTDEKDWRWSVSSSDLDRALGAGSEALNVWSSWTSIDGRRSETVHVWTALVAIARAPALVRALQTADDPHSYRIPMASDDGEIDQGPYRLQGWIEGRSGVSGLDDTDPWAARVSYPCQKPAGFVQDLLDLCPDEDFRWWGATGERDGAVMSCQVWASEPSDSISDSEGEHGSRLTMSRETLNTLLSRLQMAMIAEVSIKRRIRRYRNESGGGDDYSVPPYFKIFLLTPDGQLKTLRDCR